jgi:hypothetical protein
VKLAAIKDAVDRSGLAAKNAVSVEVGISKPFERVFDSIIAGPRDPKTHPALAELPQSENAEIIGEVDDDLPRFQPQRESETAEIVDVEIVNPDGYTDAFKPAPLTPDADDSSASEPYNPGGPLGGHRQVI